MPEIDAWGRGELQKKPKPHPTNLIFPKERGFAGMNLIIDGNEFWWSKELQEWLPTVETLTKVSGPTEKSWPESH